MLTTLRNTLPRREIDSVRSELEEIANRLAQLGERAVSGGQARVAEELQNLQETVDEALTRVGGAGRRAARHVGHTVQEHPISALVTAAAVGALFALLLSRRG